tara:strand:+ start:572 stop:2104 length:1533 start_codon:yes stop_codon:yes gene_type:complete
MDTSLGALRERLLNFRAWDSSGTTLNNRIREAMNTALDRLAGDVPEALVPDEEHIVLLPDVTGSASTVLARLRATSDNRVLEFTTAANGLLGATPTWSPTVDGTWDGIMHIEIKDPDGTWHRRQSREWWTTGVGAGTTYYVTIDRRWPNATDTLMDFRIHQPEFFFEDDVMEVLEPARIWDSSKQQAWKIDTAGAYRQDMVDFQGNSTGRPYRLWRGRHFQMPTPRQQPDAVVDAKTAWVGPEQAGKFRFCYTIVWGKRDAEWEYAPGGTQDPQWESAPSPVSAQVLVDPQEVPNRIPNPLGNRSGAGSVVMRAENIDFMTDFDIAATTRESRSGYRIRFYVARDSFDLAQPTSASDNIVEAAGLFYLLAEVDPATVSPTASYTWDGSVIPDFMRPLKHSTGYYAWKAYPHQDARYELDFRVLRLPRKFVDDQDTAPIQRDAVPALIELSLYYMCLLDGVDQQGAQLHLDRFQSLARRYRARYANPGGVVEAVSITGHIARGQYGTFSSS